jgi:hypothetical protein
MPRKANPGKGRLRDFVERANSDPLARLQFLVDPDRALDEAGIELNEELKSELRSLVHDYVERFPNIALLPTGLPSRSRERPALTADAGAGSPEARTVSGCDAEKIFII